MRQRTLALATLGHLILTACGGDSPGFPPAPTTEVTSGTGSSNSISATSTRIDGLAAGYRRTCAADGAGRVYCWGANDRGQLGSNEAAGSVTPRLVPTGQLFMPVAGKDFSCASSYFYGGHRFYCWGANDKGQLGDGTTTDRFLPTPVPDYNLYPYADHLLYAGESYVCTSTDLNSWPVYCWGDNSAGQFGNGGTASSSRAIPAMATTLFQPLSAGGNHSCGLQHDGGTSTVFCWGSNSHGQLGNGSDEDALRPRPIVGSSLLVAAAAGGLHTCALTAAHRATCWGANSRGQLGNNGSNDSPVPEWVQTDLQFLQIAAGHSHTCGISRDDRLWCWGSNSRGQLGNDSLVDSRVPTAVGGGLLFAEIALGYEHTCGRTLQGKVYCWGSNGDGQIGDGSKTDRSLPVAVVGLPF